MSDAFEEYAERFIDLLDDMKGDGVDEVPLIMKWVQGYVEGRLGDNRENGDVLIYQTDDMDIIIQVEPSDLDDLPRMH